MKDVLPYSSTLVLPPVGPPVGDKLSTTSTWYHVYGTLLVVKLKLCTFHKLDGMEVRRRVLRWYLDVAVDSM
jgi:hypothetical protein